MMLSFGDENACPQTIDRSQKHDSLARGMFLS